MARGTLAYIEPDVLRWARESSGYSVQEAARKIGIRWWQLEAAEGGSDYLTLRQAESAAETYERSLADLFLPSAPEEEPQEAQFRRLPGAPEPPWPAEMQLLARRVRERQGAAVELYDLLDEPPPWRQTEGLLRAQDRSELATLARRRLGVGRDEQMSWRPTSSRQGYAALRAWIDAVESLGILVMQDGSMPVETMRGFASIESPVPAIVVNSGDDPRARVFTLIHELGHLALIANRFTAGPETELWCNEFAGEVLMPLGWLSEEFSRTQGGDPRRRVDAVARAFAVTPLAAAVRIRRTGLLPPSEAEEVIAALRGRGDGGEHIRGGNYYWNKIGQLGPTFIRLVFTALDTDAVTYPTASTLLGNVKVNNLDKLRDYLARRAEAS
jgi:Zn-dependent peptidase ImmA (M78 family)